MAFASPTPTPRMVFRVTQHPAAAVRSMDEGHSTPSATQPTSRRHARAIERQEAAIVRTAAEGRSSHAKVVAGSPPIYLTRRAMRESARRAAQTLPVTLAEQEYQAPRISMDAPGLGNGGEHAPRPRPATRRPQVTAPGASLASPPARPPRRARRVARKITAGASLLFIGSLVVVTSLPAEALPAPRELDPAVAQIEPETQALAPVASEATAILARDDIVVRDPVAAARATPSELAVLQAVADSEPARSSFGGDPAFPQTWSMLETDYVQTPFPDMQQLPISSPFGYRAGGFHGGTDIPLPTGQEIRPVANGVVSEVWQGDNPGGGGYVVFIDHNIDGQFVQSWYAHMVPGSIRVEVGQVVDITTVIGEVGNSGRSTGPHLHLEMKNSDYVSFDPVLWLQTRETKLESNY